MKSICSRTMCIILVTIILVVSCACGKQKTSEEITQPTETPTETYATTTIETEPEVTATTDQTKVTEATEAPIPDFVELSDMDLDAAVAKMMPIMTGCALYTYEEEIVYSSLSLNDKDLIFGVTNCILDQLFPGEDSFEISYEEMDEVVHSSFPEYSGDVVALMTRDNVTYNEQTKIFQVEGSASGKIRAEIVGFTIQGGSEFRVLMYLVDDSSGDILRTVNIWMASNSVTETVEQNANPLRITGVTNLEPLSSDPEENEVLNLMYPILKGITYTLIDSDFEDYINAEEEYVKSVFSDAASYYPYSIIPCIWETGYSALIIPLRIMKEIENACYMRENDYVFIWPADHILIYNEENETFFINEGDPGTIVPEMESYVINNDGTMDVIMTYIEDPRRYLFHLVPNEYSKTISNPIFPYCVAEITELES